MEDVHSGGGTFPGVGTKVIICDEVEQAAEVVGSFAFLFDSGFVDSTKQFTYDYIGQLLSAKSQDYPDTLVKYTYGRGGNRQKLIRYDGSPDTLIYSYNGSRLTEASDRDSLFRYSYDQLGRVTRFVRQRSDIVIIEPPLESAMSGGGEELEGAGPGPQPEPGPNRPDTTIYQYSDAGQLVTVHNTSTVNFYYDGQGRRIKKVKGDIVTVYIPGDDGEVLSEYWNGVYVADYIYLNGRPLARITNGSISSVQYYINDHLGTPIAMVNSAKALQWRVDTYPFGEVYDELTSSSNNLRFPGQWSDPETGLSYNWHRYYDPRTGRYIQPDPLGVAAGPNLYSYARGNPISYGDPGGKNPLLLAYAAWEFYQTALDVYALAKSLLDPCATWEERAILFAGLAVGVLLPGGGYGRAGKAAIRAEEKALAHAAEMRAARMAAKGQVHHPISRAVHNALERHPNLKGKYLPRDPRFSTRAKDLGSHYGYEDWHRAHDKMLVDMVDSHPEWSDTEFEEYLINLYDQPEYLNRFPEGL